MGSEAPRGPASRRHRLGVRMGSDRARRGRDQTDRGSISTLSALARGRGPDRPDTPGAFRQRAREAHERPGRRGMDPSDPSGPGARPMNPRIKKHAPIIREVINRFAPDGPAATNENVEFFQAAFIRRTLTKAIKSGELSDKGKRAAEAA